MSSPSRLGQAYVRSPRRGSSSERRVARRRQLNLGHLEDRSVPSFLAPVNNPAGGYPVAIASGLFNNDAIPDLVVANSAASTVSVFLGNGDGSFGSAIDSATGANPNSIAVGDFDADGKLDVATANGGDVSVLRGNGDGTFQAPTSLSVGDSPVSVASGDFTGDGKMDLGVTSNTYYPGWWDSYWGWNPGWYVGHANVMIGNGAGSFAAPMASYLGQGYHMGAAADDFNGDGRDDFAACNIDYSLVDVVLADSTGALGSLQELGAGYSPQSVTAGDLSGDGKSDLVTANWGGQDVSVLLGNGSGGFGGAQDYNAGGNPTSVILGDFNAMGGDGKMDIAVATGNGSGVVVLLGAGGGVFRPPVAALSSEYLGGIAAGDFNGDGWLDAAAAAGSANSASVFTNDHNWPALDAPSLSINDITITEGNTGTTMANFTVSLSSVPGQTVNVDYTTVDGTATVADGDYQLTSGTLIFGPNDLTKTIPVPINGDRNAEWTEGFSVRLGSPSNVFVSDGLGAGTINDDEPTITIVPSVSGKEGDTGTTPFSFTVNVSSDYDADISVDYATADLTDDEQYWYGPGATAGVDYQAASSTLVIPAHTPSATIPVSVIGDRVGEPDELFWMNINGSNYAHVGYPNRSLATIQNDEPLVSIANATSVTEGNTGTTTTMNFTVSLSVPAAAPITVSFATADGSATVAGGDYVANSNSVIFNIGDQTKTIPVTIKGDQLGENDEYLYVNLTGADGAVISGYGYGYGYILDDEPKININSPASIMEGDKGTKPLTFTVTLSAPATQTVTVFYQTFNSSAAAGSDYVATSGTLTFTQGQSSKTITVQIKGDNKKENTEYFYVQLSNASSNSLISNSTGWGTILDDDGPHGRK